MPAVTGRRDPRGSVEVRADIPLLRQYRRPGVKSHPHRKLELALSLTRRLERTWRGRKGDEERVTLRVDLDAGVVLERLPQDAPMLGQRVRIALLAELVQQPRRPLDIRKEERNRPARQL